MLTIGVRHANLGFKATTDRGLVGVCVESEGCTK